MNIVSLWLDLRPSGILEMVESNLTFPLPHSHTLLACTYKDVFNSQDIVLQPLSLIPGMLSMYLYGLCVIGFDNSSGLPWWAVDQTPLMRMRLRARSDAFLPLSIKQVLPLLQSGPGILGEDGSLNGSTLGNSPIRVD